MIMLAGLHPNTYYRVLDTERPTLQHTTQNIRVANGNKMQPLGEVELPLDFGAGIIYQHVILAETETPLVFGNEFLIDNHCTIDVGDRLVNFGNKRITCHLEDELPSLFRIRLSTNTVVLPNCEKILAAYIQSNEDTIIPTDLLLEGSERVLASKGLAIARALIDPVSQTIPVRALNVGEQEVKLFKDTILAFDHQVQKIQDPFPNDAKCYTVKQDSAADSTGTREWDSVFL